MNNLEIKEIITNCFKRTTVIQASEKQETLYVNEVFNDENKIQERWIQDWNCNDIKLFKIHIKNKFTR